MKITSKTFSTGLWSLKIDIYSFPDDCCDLTSRVARSIHTTNTPIIYKLTIYHLQYNLHYTLNSDE